EDFEYHDNETDFKYHDNDKDEDLDPNRVLSEENEEKEEDALITLPSVFNERTLEHPGSPVCKKCGEKFSTDTGISTLKHHLENKHNIKIPQVITNQTKLSFSRIDL
ncbi:9294_t:CDS:2, partial [Funneliformis geosporum]